MARLTYLTIDDLNESFQRNKFGIDYIERFNDVETLNILNYFPKLYTCSSLSIIWNWEKILNVINRINKLNPAYVFVLVPSAKFQVAIVLFIILSFYIHLLINLLNMRIFS